MRSPEKFVPYGGVDTGILIKRTGYIIVHLVEQATVGLPYFPRLNLGAMLRHVYVPKHLKVYNKMFNLDASKIREFLGKTSNATITQNLGAVRNSFLFDVTPYMSFLHSKLQSMRYAEFGNQFLTNTISFLKEGLVSVKEDVKTIFIYTVDESLLQPGMKDVDLTSYFLIRNIMMNDNEPGIFPFDMGFLNVMNRDKSTYRMFYDEGIPVSYSRFRSLMVNIKPDMSVVKKDDEKTPAKVEPVKQEEPTKPKEHVLDKEDNLPIKSSDPDDDVFVPKAKSVPSDEINPDSELSYDFLNSKSNPVVKPVGTSKLRNICSVIASTLISKHGIKEEYRGEIEKRTFEFFSRRPEEAKEAENLFDAKDFDKLSVYIGQANEKFESNVYPTKPPVERKVLEELDVWSNRHGYDRVSDIDPVMNGNVISKVFPCNLHRVMAQKQLTWESMPEEIEKVCYKVLEDAGFQLLGISIIDREPDPKQIEPTFMSEIKIKVKNMKTRKVQTLNFLIPTLLEGKYHISGGIKWLSPNVLATLPIFVIAPGKVQFRSNYSAATFNHSITSKKDSVIVLIGGMKMPILQLLLQFKSWNDICKDFGIEYRMIQVKKEAVENEILIKMPDGRIMAIKTPEKNSKMSMALITDLTTLIRKLDSFDPNVADVNSETLDKTTGKRSASYVMKKIRRYMIDARTAEILAKRSIKPDLYEVTKKCMELTINDVTEDKLGIDNVIIRLMDIVPAEVERALHYSVTEWRRRSAIEPDANLQVNEGWIINSLRENSVHMLYKDGNPTIETAQFTAVRLVGPGGFSKVDTIQVKDRRIPPTHFGVLDPVDTAESNPGAQLYLTTGFEYDPKNKVFQHVGQTDDYQHTFSAGASLIPFVSCDDGNRVQYGSSQMRQTIPILNSQLPLVATGMEGIMANYLSDKFVKRATKNGTVEYIDENVIILKYDDGTREKFDVRPSALQTGIGKHNGLVHTPTVKVGERVKAWQHLVKNQFIQTSYSAGSNVLAAYKPEQGFSFEDGIVVSESFAKLYTSVHYENIDVLVDSVSELKIFPLQKFKETGSLEYESGEPIIRLSTPSLGGYQESTIIAPTKCRVIDIKVYPAKEEFIPLAREIDKLVYGKTNESLRNAGLKPMTNINDVTSNVGKFQVRKDLLTRTMIRITVLEYRSIGLGDKLNNRHGNKGVVTKILPDDEMPRLKDGRPLQVIFNPLGVISRMNIGQLYEIHCGNILDSAKKRLMELNPEDARNMLCQLYTLLDGYDDKRLSKELVHNLRSLSSSQLQAVLDNMKQNGVHMIFPPYKVPKIEELEKAADLVHTELQSKLYLPKYSRYTAVPVTWGILFVNKLEHISAIKQNVRSVGPYMKTTLQPGKPGNHRNAVRIGEFDAWAYLGYDALDVLKDMFLVNGDNPKLKSKVIYELETDGHSDIKESDVQEATEGGSVQSFEVFMTVAGIKV